MHFHCRLDLGDLALIRCTDARLLYGKVVGVGEESYEFQKGDGTSVLTVPYESISYTQKCNGRNPLDLTAIHCVRQYDRDNILDHLDRGFMLLVDDSGKVFTESTGYYIANVKFVEPGTGDWCP